MGDGEPDVGVLVCRAGDQVEPVVAQVRVVDARKCERGVGDLQLVATVGQVEPAGLDVGTLEVGPGSCGLSVCRLPVSGSR